MNDGNWLLRTPSVHLNIAVTHYGVEYAVNVVRNLLNAIQATLNQLSLEEALLLKKDESLIGNEEHGVTPGVPGNVEHEAPENQTGNNQERKNRAYTEKNPGRKRYKKRKRGPKYTVKENKRMLLTDDEDVLRRPLSLELIGHMP